MDYIQGDSREQSLLFPEAIDEYITENNPARFIDAYVDSLDMEKLGFTRARPAKTGRPPYQPADMLKLYVYGYFNRIRSSRRLEAECHRNVELMWLLRKLRPDFKTIADFRRDNRRAFKQVFRDFVLLCRKLDLFGKELVAIDGSKFKAQNNKDKNFCDSFLKKKIEEIDERLEKYLAEMDEGDKNEAGMPAVEVKDLQSKIEHFRQKRGEYKAMCRAMEKSGETQVSLTDSDSRSFPAKFGVDVGFNVQTAVDSKHSLIAEQDVVNAVTDIEQLSRMAIGAKHALGVEKLDVVADAGYSNSREVAYCEKAGINAYTPRIPTSANRKRGLYSKEMFRYDPAQNCYWCPAGKQLTYRFDYFDKWRNKTRRVRAYECAECCGCHLKSKCTRAVRRRIQRAAEDDAIDRMNERLKNHPEILQKRKQIAEHPFGTIKFWNGQKDFLTRGLENVRGEFSLSALVYNIRRAINILGVKKMTEALA
jgi:transposase